MLRPVGHWAGVRSRSHDTGVQVAAWHSDNTVGRSYSTPSLVSTEMGDRVRGYIVLATQANSASYPQRVRK